MYHDDDHDHRHKDYIRDEVEVVTYESFINNLCITSIYHIYLSNYLCSLQVKIIVTRRELL